MPETLTSIAKLRFIREIEEDEDGVVLRFQQGDDRREPDFARQLQLARRSQERAHPVGVAFGDGHVITEMIRADNDVPTQLWDENADGPCVLFQGHDGVMQFAAMIGFGLVPKNQN